MTLPGVDVSKSGNNLGLTAPSASRALVIGTSTQGTALTTYSFGQVGAITSALGRGPAVTAAGHILSVTPGTVDVMVTTGSVAGEVESVTSTCTSGSIGVTGTPYEAYEGSVTISKAGALGVAEFTFSLDGSTQSPAIKTAATYAMPSTGLTLSFSSSNYYIGDTATFTTSAPCMSAVDVSEMLTEYRKLSRTPTLILVAQDNLTASADVFEQVDAQLTLFDNSDIFTQAVVPTGGKDGDTGSVLTEFSSIDASEGNVIALVAERDRIAAPSPIMGQARPSVPFAYKVAARAHRNITRGHLSTMIAEVNAGPLTAVSDPTYDEFVDGEVYKSARIIAPRTFTGRSGTYTNLDTLKSTLGSDYRYWPWGVVINRAAQVVSFGLQRYVNTDVEVNTAGTGTISEADAALIEADINAQLDAALKKTLNGRGTRGLVSGVQFSVDRTNNVLSTSNMLTTTLVVPRAIVTDISAGISFASSIPVTVTATE